jgi:hypothetical protein
MRRQQVFDGRTHSPAAAKALPDLQKAIDAKIPSVLFVALLAG